MSHQSKEAPAFITSFDLDAHHNKPEEHDNSPSDRQPPGVDEEEWEPRSLEEALLGE